MAYAVDVSALPTGGVVAKGRADISQSGTHMHINQHSDKAVINWQGFDVGRDAHVQFQQNSAHAIALNRVVSGDASQIHGRISANGQVYLLNPSGVVFGQSARVDVGGLVASAHDMSDDDFLNGKPVFTRNGAGGKVENHGVITTHDGGDVVLIGTRVENHGNIAAQGGTIALAAGDRITLDAGANGYLQVAVDGATLDTLAMNGGVLQADGGQIIMNAQSAGAAYASVVSNTGAVQAQTLQNKKGRILLLADMAHGEVKVSGRLDASAPDGGDGGFVETSAAKVNVADTAHITTKAEGGKTGNWLIDPDDYTIAASGGNITGAALAANLAGTNITLETNAAGSGGNGDILVNDAVSWNANTTLTLTADRNININKNISASGNSAGLVLEYGRAGSGGYMVNDGASVTLSGAAASLRIGQSGSLQNYTLIHDFTALQAMNGNLSGYYALGNNIDASASIGSGFNPIGNGGGAFSGQFHGLGHSISNLTISQAGQDYAGLFGYAFGAALRDVTLAGGAIEGKDFTGALSGRIVNTSILNAHASAVVTGADNVGGLIGQMDNNSVTRSSATGTVSGNASVGGLVGNSLGNITESYASGNVNGSLDIGGLTGANGGTITLSYATGAVSGNFDIGGLIGANVGNVSESFATGNVTGNVNYAGGLAGYNSGTMNNVYATGDVTGNNFVGGLTGYNFITLTNAYFSGAITGAPANAGGVAGFNAGSITSSFWNSDTAGIADNGAGAALTTAQMKQLASFSGWDISAQGGEATAWRIYEGNSMPLLRGFFADTFTVTAKNATAVEGSPHYGGNGTVPAVFPAGISGSVSYGGDSQGASAAGSYAITPQGLYSGQFGYDIVFVDGQLTINAAPPFTPRDSDAGVDGGVLSLPLKTQEQAEMAASSEDGDESLSHKFDNAETKRGLFGQFLKLAENFIPI